MKVLRAAGAGVSLLQMQSLALTLYRHLVHQVGAVVTGTFVTLNYLVWSQPDFQTVMRRDPWATLCCSTVNAG